MLKHSGVHSIGEGVDTRLRYEASDVFPIVQASGMAKLIWSSATIRLALVTLVSTSLEAASAKWRTVRVDIMLWRTV